MRLAKPGILFSVFYPRAGSRLQTGDRSLWLTFDDGPDPGSTSAILGILEKQDVRAMFFCTGHKAEEYPVLVEAIRSRGHVTGNHGYSHLDGFKTSCKDYLDDAAKANELTSPEFFRPPYGRMTPCQYNQLKRKYKIILWDLMAYDFDRSFGPVRSLELLKRNLHPGSIIVLHDSPLSCAAEILPGYIEFARGEGYRFLVSEP